MHGIEKIKALNQRAEEEAAERKAELDLIERAVDHLKAAAKDGYGGWSLIDGLTGILQKNGRA